MFSCFGTVSHRIYGFFNHPEDIGSYAGVVDMLILQILSQCMVLEALRTTSRLLADNESLRVWLP